MYYNTPPRLKYAAASPSCNTCTASSACVVTRVHFQESLRAVEESDNVAVTYPSRSRSHIATDGFMSWLRVEADMEVDITREV